MVWISEVVNGSSTVEISEGNATGNDTITLVGEVTGSAITISEGTAANDLIIIGTSGATSTVALNGTSSVSVTEGVATGSDTITIYGEVQGTAITITAGPITMESPLPPDCPLTF